jgi:hypothetical protein
VISPSAPVRFGTIMNRAFASPLAVIMCSQAGAVSNHGSSGSDPMAVG